ncbi:hypothetical protein KP509_11G076000 [Ceratopteris richardii]|uniref:Uncharacterized protein n=1 Tax=Ceratopteris richardii TaxID=49495 RepID=A0A8T2TSW9_CERRI|nr:hypothetical protein KP509_11G076000 [Ceratopteris richardii]
MASSHCQCIHFCRPSFYGHGQSRLVPVRLPLSISIFSSPISIQYRGFKCRPKLVFKDSVSSPLPFFSLSSSSPSSGPLEEEPLVGTNDPSLRKSEKGAWKLLKEANTFLPHVVLASTLLALIFPPSFTWFTNRYYAPALGFLMFAVGINLNPSDFINAFQRPWILLAGYIGQFLIKPFLGVLFATLGVSVLHLPPAIGSGMILVSCVSGAQLSNYATFLVEQEMAPLSIVMTAISTATAVFVTPALTSLLLGKRLPVDFWGMVVNITQIVVAPIATGIVLKQV